MIKGYSTREGTKQYYSRMERTYPNLIAESWYNRIEGLDFFPSRLGFGGYRIHYQHKEHVEALREALISGINVIDTSTNYGDGGSEILIGNVLRELLESSRIKREEIIIISKAGYVQGKNLRLYLERNFPEMIQLDEYLYHCIHPEFLEVQIELSRKRIGLETIDVYLLHNPEYFLKKYQDQKTYLKRIEKALDFLEKKRLEGIIRYYGISSNTLVEEPHHPEFTNLKEILKFAPPGFKIVQFPANLLENGYLKNSFLDLARSYNLWTISNRPFNSIYENKLYRIARMPYEYVNGEKNPEAIFLQLEEQLKNLENQLIKNLSDKHFTFDQNYCSPYETIQYYLKFINEPEMVYPFLRSISIPFQKTVSFLRILIYDSKSEKIKKVYEDYIRVLNYILVYLSNYLFYRNHIRLENLEKKLLENEPVYSYLPLTLKILTILLGNGIHTVLAGMRKTLYVRQLQKIFSLPILNKKILVDKDLIIKSKL